LKEKESGKLIMGLG